MDDAMLREPMNKKEFERLTEIALHCRNQELTAELRVSKRETEKLKEAASKYADKININGYFFDNRTIVFFFLAVKLTNSELNLNHLGVKTLR